MTSSKAVAKSALSVLLLLMLNLYLLAFAQAQPRRWIAVSRTAASITGDVEIAPDHISFARRTFKIQLVRDLSTAKLADAGRIVDELQTPISAQVFRTTIPRSSILLNGNDICGTEDAKWMLAVYGKSYLSLAFFSGSHEPNLDYKSVQVSHDLCGTYGYTSAD